MNLMLVNYKKLKEEKINLKVKDDAGNTGGALATAYDDHDLLPVI